MKKWYDKDNLARCWEIVRKKGSGGGIDKRSIADYQQQAERRLTALAGKLAEKSYNPTPGQRINIPKSDGNQRPIALLTIEDKIVQMAVKHHIEPRFEAVFSRDSYAYRPGVGHQQAISRVSELISRNYRWIGTFDIDDYFDTIDHEILLAKVRSKVSEAYILQLIQHWLKVGVFQNKKYRENPRGIPQGGVISPLLANIYLHALDLKMNKRKAAYVRYADDILLLGETREDVQAHYQSAKQYLINERKLQLNESKRPVFPVEDGFTYLGVHFQGNRRRIDEAKFDKALRKVGGIAHSAEQHVGKQQGQPPFVYAIQKYNEAISGWKYYYGQCEHEHEFEMLQTKIFYRLARLAQRIKSDDQSRSPEYFLNELKYLKTLSGLSGNDRKKAFQRIAAGRDLTFRNRLQKLKSGPELTDQQKPENLSACKALIDRIFLQTTHDPADNQPLNTLIKHLNQLNPGIPDHLSIRERCGLQNKIFAKTAHFIQTLKTQNQLPEAQKLAAQLDKLQTIVPIKAHFRQKAINAMRHGRPYSINENLLESQTAAQPRIEKNNEQPIEHPDTPRAEKKETPTATTQNAKISRAISAKKRQYQRYFATESDLIISNYGAKIGKESKQIVVTTSDGEKRRIAAHKLKHIIVTNTATSVTGAAVELCVEKSIPITYIDSWGRPYARLSGLEKPAWEYGLLQTRAKEDGKGLHIVKAIITGKVKNQQNLLKYYAKYRAKTDPDFARVYFLEIRRMDQSLNQIAEIPFDTPLQKAGDIIRGLEGQAGSGYWNVVKELLKDRVIFKRRERKGAKDVVNSMLNYGYGVLYTHIWSALVMHGFNVQVSFLHQPQYGKPTLVYDIIEEYRAQVIDRVVFSMINKGIKTELTREGYLTQKSKDRLLNNVIQRLKTPVHFRHKEKTPEEIIHYQLRAIATYLRGDSRAYRPFIAKW